MKKLLILLSTVALLASCKDRKEFKLQDPAAKWAATKSASGYQNTIHQFVRQFDFDPSAIYGDIFTNKAWH